MGSFVAKDIKIDGNRIMVYGASKNERPLTFGWAWYNLDKKENMFYDLVSGMLQFPFNTKICKKVNSVMEKIEKIHMDKYPYCDDGPCCDYSLYTMLCTHRNNKDFVLKDMIKNITAWQPKYRLEVMRKHELYSEKYEEFAEHTEKLYQIFIQSGILGETKPQLKLELCM